MPWWSGRRRSALLVAPMTGALLLAGCTGGDPSDLTSPTSSPSASATAGPSEDPLPARPQPPSALDAPPSIDGAVAVARYFVELYPYVFATNDQTDWTDLSAADCIFCQDVINDASTLADEGHRREGGAVAVGFAVGSEIGAASSYSVELTMDEAPARVVDVEGVPVDDWSTAQSYRTVVVLLHDGDRWTVRAVEPTAIDT